MAKTMVSWQAFPSLPPPSLPPCAPLPFPSRPKPPFPSLSNGLAWPGKQEVVWGGERGRKGCFARRLSPIFFLIDPPFFFSFSPSAEPGLRLGSATLRYINPSQTNSLNPTKITVLMCEQKPYFCGRKGIRPKNT